MLLKAVLITDGVPASFTLIYPSDVTGDTNTLNLDSTSLGDIFVANLPTGQIVVPNTAVDSATGKWQTSPVSSDNFLLSFESFFNTAQNVNISLSGTNAVISEIDVKMDLPAVTGTTTVTFSSTTDVTSVPYATTGDSTKSVTAQGFFTNGTGILMGLVADAGCKAVSITLSDLLQMVGTDIPEFLLPKSSLTLLVDQSMANGIWYYPGDNNTIISRLRFATADPSLLTAPIAGLTFTDTIVSIKNYALTYTAAEATAPSSFKDYITNRSILTLQAKLQLANQSPSWDTFMTVGNGTLDLVLQWNNDTGDPLAQFWTWVEAELKFDAHGTFTSFDKVRSYLNAFTFREISISLSYGNGYFSMQRFTIIFEVDLKWGISSTNPADLVPLEFTFTYCPSSTSAPAYASFDGQIWTPPNASLAPLALINPDAPMYPEQVPTCQSNAQYYIDLRSLLTQNDQYGSQKTQAIDKMTFFPTALTNLQFTLSTTDVSFQGTLMQNPNTAAPTTVPWLQFDELILRATWTYPSTLDFYADCTLTLSPKLPDDQTEGATYCAMLSASIEYTLSGAGVTTFTVTASGSGLNGACLYSLFPDTDNDAVMDVLRDITVVNFDLEYYHESSDMSFSASADILLGDVWLDVTFENNVQGSKVWSFEASLADDFSGSDLSLGSFLAGISADLAADIPALVANQTFSALGDCSVDLKVQNVAASTNAFIILSVVAKVDEFEFSFVQWRQIVTDGSTPPGES